MGQVNVTLPDIEQEFVEKQVADGPFADAAAYLAHLVHEARKRQAKERLDALLVEGLESGDAALMTPEDWAELRDRLKRHVEQREKNGAQVGGGKVST